MDLNSFPNCLCDIHLFILFYHYDLENYHRPTTKSYFKTHKPTAFWMTTIVSIYWYFFIRHAPHRRRGLLLVIKEEERRGTNKREGDGRRGKGESRLVFKKEQMKVLTIMLKFRIYMFLSITCILWRG